jgi:hypothetical protein
MSAPMKPIAVAEAATILVLGVSLGSVSRGEHPNGSIGNAHPLDARQVGVGGGSRHRRSAWVRPSGRAGSGSEEWIAIWRPNDERQ